MSPNTSPQIRKAKRIVGKNLIFRDADIDDAEFILSLRQDATKSKFLSSASAELQDQINWLEDYAKGNTQAYFIIENLDNEKLGTVRLYDQQGNSFCWGSWILKDGSPQSAAIESALMVYIYALDYLGFEQAHFDVRKGNTKVWQFHERLGADKTHETTNDYFYKLTKANISNAVKKYKKYIIQPLTIEIHNEY